MSEQVCSVCFGFFVLIGDEVRLPCGHFVCEGCLNDPIVPSASQR